MATTEEEMSMGKTTKVTREQFLANVTKGHEANAAHMRKMACPDQERWYLEVAAAVRSLIVPIPTKDPR